MKILVLNRWVGYNQGGAETAVKDTIENFMNENEITLITSRGDYTKYLHSKVDVEYVNIPKHYYSYGYLGLPLSILFFLCSLYKYFNLRILRKKKFDLVISFFSLDCVTSRFIRLIDKTPYVHIMQGTTSLEMIEGKRANKVIAISEFCRSQCLKNNFEAVKIVKGIDTQKFNFKKRKNDDLNKIPTFLTVCRLEPRKNLETLIKACSILKKKNFNFKSIIVGDGILMNQYQELSESHNLSENIEFTGFIQNNDPKLSKLYNNSDLFILPTLYECCGYVYLESIACGLPIIAANNSCMPEIVGDCGLLFNTEDYVDLAKKIEYFFTNQNIRNNIHDNIEKRHKDMSWTYVKPLYEEVFRDAISNDQNLNFIRIKTFFFIVKDFFKIIVTLFKHQVIFNTKNTFQWSNKGMVGK